MISIKLIIMQMWMNVLLMWTIVSISVAIPMDLICAVVGKGSDLTVMDINAMVSSITKACLFE